MKPSIEAKHVLGEKKPRHPLTVAKRIGRAIGDPFPSAFGGRITQEIVAEESLHNEAVARSRVLNAMNGLEEVPAFKEAQASSRDGIVSLRADLPTATIEATSQLSRDYKFMEPLETWTIQVTTKAEKPLVSLFEVERTPVYSRDYALIGQSTDVSSINPKNGENYLYFNDRDDIRLYSTVARCFDELGQAVEEDRLTIEPDRLEQVA